MAAILPLCELDEVRAELDDTEQLLSQMGYRPIVHAGRWVERVERLNRWRDRLREQIAEMEADSGNA